MSLFVVAADHTKNRGVVATLIHRQEVLLQSFDQEVAQ